MDNDTWSVFGAGGCDSMFGSDDDRGFIGGVVGSSPMGAGICARSFANDQIDSEFRGLVHDVISIYKFEESSPEFGISKKENRLPKKKGVIPKPAKYGIGNVYNYEESSLKLNTLGFVDIMLSCYWGVRQSVAMIDLVDPPTKYKYTCFVKFDGSNKIGDDYFIDMGERFGKVKPRRVVTIDPIFSRRTIGVLRLLFGHLYNVYSSADRLDALDKMLLFKVEGFHSTFTENRTHEAIDVAKANRVDMRNHYNAILKTGTGIIDSKDDVSYSSIGKDNADFMRSHVDFIYTEFARYTKIPLTKLLGYAPQGLNATGEYDERNYEQTLERCRRGYFEPFLDTMGIKYTRIARYDLEEMEKIVNIYNQAGVSINEDLKKRIEEIGIKS